VRGLGFHTQQDYIRYVRRFATFLGRTPDTATVEDIQRFQLYQHENGVGPATINSTVSALRFLFMVTLKRRDMARALVITRNPRKLLNVSSCSSAENLGHQSGLSIGGSGSILRHDFAGGDGVCHGYCLGSSLRFLV